MTRHLSSIFRSGHTLVALLSVFALLIACSGCDLSSVTGGADAKFGDQNFKSAVALIELHRTRTGEYPATLDEMEHLGDWDQIWLSAVRYERVANGYNLFVERGWVSEPELRLPRSYQEGLGIRETNVIWVPET